MMATLAFNELIEHGTWPTTRYSHGIFKKYFTWFKGLDIKFRSFFIYQPTAINQKPIKMGLWFLTLFKVCNKAIKTATILN